MLDLKIDEKFEPDMKKWKIIKEQNREIAKGKQSFLLSLILADVALSQCDQIGRFFISYWQQIV